ncbi:MAG: nucleoside triphosphate pyrophosphohydrolase [Candidatus Nanoarchaeia archaeon]|nr:nucleoside triphosphate pyrophosphohydrolase [Candidatus Nanoarchaeia archaeon]
MEYKDKLVRDKIPEIIKERTGKSPKTHIANKEEYMQKLKEKLKEEVSEFLEDNNAEELSDILEVIYNLAYSINVTKDKLEELRTKKVAERGSFKDKIILEEVKK